MTTKKHKVFVYGTLREHGVPATHVLWGYVMYNYGDKFPYIIPSEGRFAEPTEVFGNIREVNDEELAQLDRYEGVDRGLYKRVKVTAEHLYEDEADEAWTYVGDDIADEMIESGDWLHASKEL